MKSLKAATEIQRAEEALLALIKKPMGRPPLAEEDVLKNVPVRLNLKHRKEFKRRTVHALRLWLDTPWGPPPKKMQKPAKPRKVR